MPMATRPRLVEHCVELMAPAGHVNARPMFGGHGLRIDGLFVALIAFDRLYLKGDALTRPQYEAAGCEPFIYQGSGKPITIGYWTVPPQAMESPRDMQPWLRLALDAALRARASKRDAAPARLRATRSAEAASNADPTAKAAARKGARGRS
jgi:DNA transformation protein and related proteins